MAPASAPDSTQSPYEDTSTPPLAPRHAYLLLLLTPYALTRLALAVSVLFAYLLLLLVLQRRRPAPGADADVPRFRAYPFLLRASRGAAHLVLAALGLKLRVSGGEHVAGAYSGKTATVVVANHVSYLDVFVVAATVGPYFPVMRADMGTWPVFGALLRLWGAQGVDRSKAGKAAGGASVAQLIADRARRTDRWARHPPLLVFPEGTCTTGTSPLLRFKPGGFVAGVPVLPLCIVYSTGATNVGWVWRDRPTRVWPLSSWPLDLVHLVRLLLQPGKEVHAIVLPPYTPSPVEQADATLFAANVRKAMAAAMHLPTTDVGSMDDARAFYAQRNPDYAKSA